MSPLIISIITSASLIIISIVLLTGRGSFLIAGFNTMPKHKKDEYDKKALCKFVGKIVLIIGLISPSTVIGEINGLNWMPAAYGFVVLALVVFMIIYLNTGNRFKK